jgi:starch synthase (maltosyl-transferring)
VDNEEIIAYTKMNEDKNNAILTVVNLDPYHSQSGWITLDMAVLGIAPEAQYIASDLLTGAKYTWQGARNYVDLNPFTSPAHVLRIETH